VTYVLLVAAFEFGNPVALVILVVAGDPSLHVRILIGQTRADTWYELVVRRDQPEILGLSRSARFASHIQPNAREKS
jgi:hypothetical protein